MVFVNSEELGGKAQREYPDNCFITRDSRQNMHFHVILFRRARHQLFICQFTAFGRLQISILFHV